VIGTGASGVQLAQEAAGVAAHLTVFPRTPNLALLMRQTKLDEVTICRMEEKYPETYCRCTKTFAGSDIDFLAKSAFEVSDDERQAIFDRLWEIGGFAPGFGTFNNIVVNEEARGSHGILETDSSPRRVPKRDSRLARARNGTGLAALP
jgi:hypothetical protein